MAGVGLRSHNLGPMRTRFCQQRFCNATKSVLTAHGLGFESRDPPRTEFVGSSGRTHYRYGLGGAEGRRHIVRFALAAACDHVRQCSQGGTDDVDNLVTACNVCNAHIRGSHELESVGLVDQRPGPLLDWPERAAPGTSVAYDTCS
jgi:HNH endonuclease